MTGIAVVASKHDAQFAEAVRAALQALQRDDVSIHDALPVSAADSFVVLIWSAALEAGHAIDVQALIGLWSEGRLLVARRDVTPLPLGMRDLESLPPDKSPAEICTLISQATKGDAAKFAVRTPAVLQSKPEDLRRDIPAFSRKQTRASPVREVQKKGPLLTKFIAVSLIASFAVGGWYWYTVGERSKVAALTAALELATKATEELSRAKQAELEAQKRAAEARAAEEAARNSGDLAALKAAIDARLKFEADAVVQAELVKQREAAAAKARDDAKKAADTAKQFAAEKAKAEPKPQVAAVAPAKSPEPVKAETPKPAAEAPKAVESRKAAAAAKAAPKAMTRSDRERLQDEAAAAKALAALAKSPAQVAAASPSAAAPAPSAGADVLYKQALALENEGKVTESIRIYRRAARAGSGKAAKRLGEIYDRGVPGVSRDYAESLQWYETARQLGEPIAMASRRGSDDVSSSSPSVVQQSETPVAAIPEARKEAPADAKADVDAEELLVQAMGAQNAGRNDEALRLFKQAASGSGIAAGLAAKRLGEAYDRGLLGVERYYSDALQYYEMARQKGAVSAARGWGSMDEIRREREVAERVERAVVARYGSAPPPQARPTAEETAAAAERTAARGRSELAYAVVLLLVVLGLGFLLWRRYGTRKDPPDIQPAAKAPQPQVTKRSGAQASPDAATLFVSYSHKDKTRVEPIVSLMEAMGRRVWMDRTDITGQAGWAGQIVRAIRECRAVVLMASPNSYSSDQVVRELYLAMNHKKTIVPIEIEPAELPDELQYILAPFQHHRLSGRETREVLGRALAAV